jgi:hypothetical protein
VRWRKTVVVESWGVGETGWKSKCTLGRAAEALGGADETGMRNETVRSGVWVRRIVTREAARSCARRTPGWRRG